MDIEKIILPFIARHRLRFGAGVGLIGSFFSIFTLLTFSKVWSETFEYYGIPPVVIYIVAPLGYFFTCWYVGYLYDRKGLWKAEVAFGNRQQNPELMEMYDDIKKIKTALNITEEKK
jgi:hypothetical protein